MSESWDKYADEWDSNESVVAYSEKAYASLLNIVNLDGLRVLDFGCGTGLLTEKISHSASSVVALDPSQKMISVLDKKHLKDVITIASELDHSLVNESELFTPKFDLIVASSALAFVPNYQNALNLLKQLLKEGGYLVQWDWLKDEGEPGYGFSEEQIQSALDHVGFSDYSTSIPFSLQSSGGSMEVVMGVARNA